MRPSTAHSSVNSVFGNSSTAFGGAYTRPPATHSSVNSVSGNSSTPFGGAYARPPAAYSPVISRPAWHNSNPFVDYLRVAVRHVEKDVNFNKVNGTQGIAKKGNRYYHWQMSYITSGHPYFSPAVLRADPMILIISQDIV